MPYAPGSDATFIKLGPGKLYFGAFGAVEPADLSAAISSTVWTYAGFTAEGNTFTFTPTYDAVEVAESLLAVANIATNQEMTLEFALVEVTAANLQKALNGATITSSGTGATSIDKVEPLAFGSVEPRVAVLWVSDDGSERWVWRRCIQTGAVAINRRKGADKATIPVSFKLEPVSSTVRPFMAILKSTATIT